MPERPKVLFRVGTFGHTQRLETEIRQVGNGAPVRTLNTEVLTNFSGWQYFVHIVTHWCWETNIS